MENSKILLVDDTNFIRIQVRQLLNRLGCTDILEAASGITALHLFKTQKPELTILDIMIPDLDGMSVLKEIKKYDQSAKVIMLSSVTQENLVRECISMGAVDYIVKPINHEHFLKRVKINLNLVE